MVFPSRRFPLNRHLPLPLFISTLSRVAIALGLIGIVGSSGVVSGIVPSGEFVKVYGSFILPYLYYWHLWQYLGEDVIRGFRVYLTGAVIVSAIGLIVFIDL